MPIYQGSKKGRSANVKRNQVGCHNRLFKPYFHLTDPVYKEVMFRRRYLMSRDLFLII
jgi:hypothetical protein